MSGASINKKIAKGLQKAGKVLGWKFSVFRPDDYTSPISDENKVFETQMSWSEDKNFVQNPEKKLAHFHLYCNYMNLKIGDIAFSTEVDRTFVVTEVNELRGAVGVQAPDRINVLRTVYTPTADKKTSFQTVMTNVPCAVGFKGGSVDHSVLTGVNSNSTGARSQIEIWTWLPVGAIDQTDTIEFLGQRFQVTGVDQDRKGTIINARSTKIGQ